MKWMLVALSAMVLAMAVYARGPASPGNGADSQCDCRGLSVGGFAVSSRHDRAAVSVARWGRSRHCLADRGHFRRPVEGDSVVVGRRKAATGRDGHQPHGICTSHTERRAASCAHLAARCEDVGQHQETFGRRSSDRNHYGISQRERQRGRFSRAGDDRRHRKTR